MLDEHRRRDPSPASLGRVRTTSLKVAIKRRSRARRRAASGFRSRRTTTAAPGRRRAVSAFYGGIKLLLNDARKVLLAASFPSRNHLWARTLTILVHPPTRQEAASCRAKSPFHPVTSHPSSSPPSSPAFRRPVLVSICPRVQI